MESFLELLLPPPENSKKSEVDSHPANVFKSLPSTVKSTLTRTFNKHSHILPYSLASGGAKKARGGALPAIMGDEMYGDAEEGADGAAAKLDDEEEEEVDDVAADLMIKVKPVKATAGTKKAGTSGRAKKKQ